MDHYWTEYNVGEVEEAYLTGTFTQWKRSEGWTVSLSTNFAEYLHEESHFEQSTPPSTAAAASTSAPAGSKRKKDASAAASAPATKIARGESAAAAAAAAGAGGSGTDEDEAARKSKKG